MNVLESISTPQLIFQICSLTQLKTEKKTWSTVQSRLLATYSSIILLLCIVILFQGIFFPILERAASSKIGDITDIVQLISMRFAHIMCTTEALARRKEQQQLIKKLQEIDRIFEISLNLDVENRQLRSDVIKYGIIVFGLYIVCEGFVLAIAFLKPTADFLQFWVFYLVPLLGCGVKYFQYLLFVAITKRRFEKLIEALGSINLLSNKKLEKNKLSGKIPATVKLMKNLDHYNKTFIEKDGLDLKNLLVIRDLYNRLWEITILVNKCFGLSLLINVAIAFLAITSNFYWMFLSFKTYTSSYGDFFRIFSSAVWSVPHIFNVMALAVMCHRTVESTSEIALGVHRIQIDLLNDNHNSLIEQFSLQLLHQKINFTAYGFFNIDCSLLYTIVGATTTYLIILIQFHMNEQKDAPQPPSIILKLNATQ